MMGFFGMGVWGMAPAYTVERFPTEVRGAGPGFCYHAGAAIGALMPWLLGKFQDKGVDLVTAHDGEHGHLGHVRARRDLERSRNQRDGSSEFDQR